MTSGLLHQNSVGQGTYVNFYAVESYFFLWNSILEVLSGVGKMSMCMIVFSYVRGARAQTIRLIEMEEVGFVSLHGLRRRI